MGSRGVLKVKICLTTCTQLKAIHLDTNIM